MNKPETVPVEQLRELWTDGNEAIRVNTDRSRPWAGTVFRKGHDGTEADALVCMTFGATAEEAASLARLIAVVPELVGALRKIAFMRPAGDVEKCTGARNLVRHMELVALAVIAKTEGGQ